jgi:RHS repeat-associated protein
LGRYLEVALGPDGSIYIADIDKHRVRRVDPDGIITTVAGTGTGGFSGDGGPANEAALNLPADVAVGPDGSIYIADYGNHRVRRVAPDGLISTVAGTGVAGFSGDDGPAVQAQLHTPTDVAIGLYGRLYIAETQGGNHSERVRRGGLEGVITTVAGLDCDWTCPLGDGGPATSAPLGGLTDITIGPDGSLYLSQGGYEPRIRRVDLEGIINTIAGNGTQGRFGAGDRGPATKAGFSGTGMGIDAGPDRNLYVADGHFWDGQTDFTSNRVRKVSPILPGLSDSEIVVLAENGTEIYVFSSAGRHLRTVNALTGAVVYQFIYDSNGLLATIEDGDGNITTIERTGFGRPTAIVGPFGQRTTLNLDIEDFLVSITNPASETVQLKHTVNGLLTSLTTPRNKQFQFTYDDDGRLTRDTDPAGGFQDLSRTESGLDYVVTHTTALTRATGYRVEQLSTGVERRISTYPDGTEVHLLMGTNDSRNTYLADGTSFGLEQGPDPRWGMEAPLPVKQMTYTPGGLVSTVSTGRTVTLADPGNLLSLTNQTDQLTINGRTYTSAYDAASRTFNDTTPAGRQSSTTIDAQGRPLLTQLSGLAPTSFSYKTYGQLANVSQGNGPEARTVTFDYNSVGYLASLTDPLSRTVSFDYDSAGRVTRQTMPDGRVIDYGYDAAGNLTSLTPPGRPAHYFNYTPVDLTGVYTPPNIGAGNWQTVYSYNLDRQLTQVSRPDGQTVDLNYDSAGRLSNLITSRGPTAYSYDPSTGKLFTVTTPESNTITYGYDGPLPTDESWAGVITGSVSHIFDNNFRITAVSVNGANPISYQYDDDSLITGAGNISLSRNAQNGLLLGSALGGVTDSWSYNAFGEPISYSVAVSGTTAFTMQYTRDKLGRITAKTETISSSTTVYSYTYDLAGRLEQVWQNGVLSATYSYDSNGNRLSYTGPGGTINGSYDDQDRLLQYGTTSYTYTANGELLSKTDGGQTITYQYDALGNLLTVTLPDSTQIDYVIDGSNRRIGKKVNGTLVQGFLYQDDLNPIAELDGGNNIVSRFVYASRANVPDYLIKGGNTYRIIADHLGSPRLVVDTDTGTVAQRMDYDEFGNILLDTNPGFQPFGFAGGIYDQHTHLIRFGTRDYNAEIGRWTVKDPILFVGSDANLYGYVLNDPINLRDSQGLAPNGCGPFGLFADLLNSPFGYNFTEACNQHDTDYETLGKPKHSADRQFLKNLLKNL